ncbi:hypothetical protein QFC19_003639 [Naganishia cerealis]|uniref:Uncharacterized protein n=1 Tax=Naganishia cerealis TaxID=610337 RepID=A0ACC2W1T8_9TREE|nr:hypothetical protein QFC19_003639 [Naganishia cerealis]
MSALKPPMTPVSMGSLPTPTPQVLPSPAKYPSGSSLPSQATGSPYQKTNLSLGSTQRLRPEHAVVFVFDATYLTREIFFKVTAKGGSLEGIMRRLVENGKQSVRVQKTLASSVNNEKMDSTAASNTDGANEQNKGKEKANQDEGILYQQYFQPYKDFIIALPLLLGYFKPARELSPDNALDIPLSGITIGFDEDLPLGKEEDHEWLNEYGINPGADEEDVKKESGLASHSRHSEESSQCLLEGTVAALELFDIQRNHHFVVPDLSSSKLTKGSTPSPFPYGKHLPNGSSALTPQSRPSPLLSSLHMTPTKTRSLISKDGQSAEGEGQMVDTYLIIFAGKDPLYSGTFESLQPGMPLSSNPSSANKTPALKDPRSDVLTGLPSPSPSPEDKHSRPSIKSSPTDSARARLLTVAENNSRLYDGFGWNQVLDEVGRRNIAFGCVILPDTDNSSNPQKEGILAKLFEALKRRQQGKKYREFLSETAWWGPKNGERAMFKGLNPARVVKSEVEMRIIIDQEKNINGKRPLAVSASPLEQDMANEAKRFKADAAAAAAARIGTPTGLPFASPVLPSGAGQNGPANTNVVSTQQFAAMQAARAQALLQRQQAALQRSAVANANGVPISINSVNPQGNGTTNEQTRNINQLKQAALAAAAPVAGAASQGLSSTQGILHMQALQNELIRQQQAQLQANQQQQLKQLPQATEASTNGEAPPNVRSAPGNPLVRPAIGRANTPTTNVRPNGEVVIWKGKISTQPSRFQQDVKARQAAPSVVALVSIKHGKLEDFLPTHWPSGYLTITGARKLDVIELQNMARKGICRFVEFRPFVEDGGDVAKNASMVQQFANKLANSALMFIYHFGPSPGCGVVLVPHRGQPNAPYRLLGACFFTNPIPATLGPLPVNKPAEPSVQKPMVAQAPPQPMSIPQPPPPQQPSHVNMMNMGNQQPTPQQQILQPPAQIMPSQVPTSMNTTASGLSQMAASSTEPNLNDLTPEQIQMLMNQLQQMQGGGGNLMT